MHWILFPKIVHTGLQKKQVFVTFPFRFPFVSLLFPFPFPFPKIWLKNQILGKFFNQILGKFQKPNFGKGKQKGNKRDVFPLNFDKADMISEKSILANTILT
jgi:hypothetical protein